MSATVEMWKIRHKTTGMFSPGGSMSYAHFTAKGKTWSEKRHVMSHISNNKKYYRARAAELEIVKMVLTEAEALEMQPEFDALIVRLGEGLRKKAIAQQNAAIRKAERQKREAEARLARLQS